MNQTMTLILMVVGILTITFIFHFGEDESNIDCSKPFDVIFLKSSEIASASELARGNVIVVIPEENQLVAETGVLDCPTFHYGDYLNIGLKGGSIGK